MSEGPLHNPPRNSDLVGSVCVSRGTQTAWKFSVGCCCSHRYYTQSAEKHMQRPTQNLSAFIYEPLEQSSSIRMIMRVRVVFRAYSVPLD